MMLTRRRALWLTDLPLRKGRVIKCALQSGHYGSVVITKVLKQSYWYSMWRGSEVDVIGYDNNYVMVRKGKEAAYCESVRYSKIMLSKYCVTRDTQGDNVGFIKDGDYEFVSNGWKDPLKNVGKALVKIISHTSSSYPWYRNRVGEQFEIHGDISTDFRVITSLTSPSFTKFLTLLRIAQIT